MPDLFFIAGYFALVSHQGNTTWAFIKKKLFHLGIPWLIGVILRLFNYSGYFFYWIFRIRFCESRKLRYNVYLIHFVFVFLFQRTLLNLDMIPAYLKAVLVFAISVAASLAVSYYALKKSRSLSVAGIFGIFALLLIFLRQVLFLIFFSSFNHLFTWPLSYNELLATEFSSKMLGPLPILFRNGRKTTIRISNQENIFKILEKFYMTR